MSDAHATETDAPMSTRAKIVSTLVFAVVVVAAVWGLFRVTSPAIRPTQTAPASHYPLPCGICHSLSDAAPLRSVR